MTELNPILSAVLNAWYGLGQSTIDAIKVIVDDQGIETDEAITDVFGIDPDDFWTAPLN